MVIILITKKDLITLTLDFLVLLQRVLWICSTRQHMRSQMPCLQESHVIRFNHAYEGRRRGWDSHTSLNTDELPSLDWHEAEGDEESPFVSIEERIPSQQTTSNSETITSPQVFWQDGIDPDSMTYEELLDLGEAVGTQSRGLSKDIILLLPVSKYKCSFFSRKKTQRERCVICQMDYKRGDRQMTLPCRHIYHASCATKWLNINKACPVCSVDVSSDIARH
ncbi:RING/U-box superfamily protein [Zostera marina]|uniref:RING/U-box superfamily protein n=1 Tax=Zostera marina TaxID=29655 RepID=A0A0K9Q6H4_ZOSMR|nr:RING/U-box superfamily protein [Zostera marina]